MMAYDLVNQDITNLSLLQPKTKGIKTNTCKFEKHKKDGRLIPKIECEHFYSNWKKDSLQWYSQQEFNNYNELNNYNRNRINGMNKDKAIELFEKTNKKKTFAIPLPTQGTNQVNILFNDACNIPTFTYKRYADTNLQSMD